MSHNKEHLAQDVKYTVQEIRKSIDGLKERWPGEHNLHLHIAYNWRVAQLIEAKIEEKWRK